MSDCPVVLGNPAASFVAGGYNTFIPLAVGAYTIAQSQAGALADFAVSPVQYSAAFDFGDPVSTFQRPVKPDIDEDALEFSDEALADLREAPEFDGNRVNLDPLPPFTTPTPSLELGAKPTPLTAQPPNDVPFIPDRTAPEEPGYVLPDVPALELIALPPRPDIEIPEWDATRPSVNLPDLVQTWDFTPQQYVSALLTKLQTQISNGMDGGTGLPAAIQDALWQRARSRVDIEVDRTVMETVDEFATRGFNEPNGILARRLDQVRQNGANQRNQLSRELVIEEARLEQTNIQFYVSQGLALEQLNVSIFFQTQNLLLAAAQFVLESSIRVYEARIGLIRLEYDIYVADASVFEARIRGELAKVEVYRADVEAAKARGELNEQLVRRYEAQIRAVATLADFYNARIAGFRAQIESDVAKAEVFRTRTQGYAELVRAKAGEWDGYRAQVEGETAKFNGFDSAVRAYVARTNGISASNQVLLDEERLNVQQYEAELRGWDGELRRVLAFIEAERTRVQAAGTVADARARIYGSEAGVESAVSAARDRTFQLGLERERSRVDVSLKNAEIQINENIQLKALLLRARETLATVSAQIAAGLASAVNFSANVGSSTSESKGCSTNINLQGEVAG